LENDQNDNLSDMVSANVSGRGTPNISGKHFLKLAGVYTAVLEELSQVKVALLPVYHGIVVHTWSMSLCLLDLNSV
jgi:uncharacterized membrane protein